MCHKGQQPLIDEPIVCYVHPQGEEVWYPTRGSPKDNILSKMENPCILFFKRNYSDIFHRYRLVFFTWHEQPKISQLDFPSQANNLVVQMILILEIRLLLRFQVMGEFNCYESSMIFNPIYTWMTPESSSMCISQLGLEIGILDLASWVQLHEKPKQNWGQKKNCQFFHTSHNTHSRHVELLLNALRKILCRHQCLEYRGSNMWSK
jgi:hypothetical protein